MTQAQKLLTFVLSRVAEIDRGQHEEYPVNSVRTGIARNVIPGLRDLGMLNSLITRDARYSTCQLPAHLGLTVRGPRTWDHRCGPSRSQLAFTWRVPQAVSQRESLIVDKRLRIRYDLMRAATHAMLRIKFIFVMYPSLYMYICIYSIICNIQMPLIHLTFSYYLNFSFPILTFHR